MKSTCLILKQGNAYSWAMVMKPKHIDFMIKEAEGHIQLRSLIPEIKETEEKDLIKGETKYVID